MTYSLLAVAEAELAEAAAWYETQAFLRHGGRVGARHRRCLFRRFPYAVLYS